VDVEPPLVYPEDDQGKPPRPRQRLVSIGGTIGLILGILYGCLTKSTDIQTHGSAYFLGGVCFEAMLGLTLGAIIGGLLSRGRGNS
jgi:hypothetical protein